MAGHVLSTAPGVQASTGVRGLRALGPNTRTKTAVGNVATVADTVLFSGATGVWVYGSSRVRAMGVPAVVEGATGLTVSTAGSTLGPLQVVQPDPRAKGT